MGSLGSIYFTWANFKGWGLLHVMKIIFLARAYFLAPWLTKKTFANFFSACIQFIGLVLIFLSSAQITVVNLH